MSQNHKCAICGEEVIQFNHFYKKHKKTESDYWMLYHPKYSKTGKKIPFKNREQYLNSDFVDKNDLRDWVKKSTKEEIISYISEYLKKRESKYLPSQVESRTLMIPSITFINEKVCEYNSLAALSNKEEKFNYTEEPEFIKSLGKHTIIQDTREQKSLSLKSKTKKEEKAALKYGDYTCSRNPFNIYIERKSLGDAIGTLSGGYERFKREITRAKQNKAYLIITIEATFNDLSGFQHGRKFRGKVSFGPDFLFHRIRELMREFDNIQFVFSGSRTASVNFIDLIYRCKSNPKKYDWQFLIDSKRIILC